MSSYAMADEAANHGAPGTSYRCRVSARGLPLSFRYCNSFLKENETAVEGEEDKKKGVNTAAEEEEEEEEEEE
ncbi:hypothetical protein WN51_06168 [Melipona quadrifasciata]|uniref:Uncharacterized protein n=1 Tax=Melipona quadrifasciata TaxID=166423 RepID=A0A0N0BCK4_9HYME|nr:hypothetical protein WN51_06168 [Melipona quadrifasciata]